MSVISFGSAPKVRDSIDRYYGTDREINLFDSMICNFNTIHYFLKNMDKNLEENNFTDTGKCLGDYRIVSFKETRYISISDFPSNLQFKDVLPKFVDTLNRRLKRLKNTISNSKQLDFIHLLDMDINYDFKENPTFPPSKIFIPSEKIINESLEIIKKINPNLNFTLHVLVPPNYSEDNMFFLNSFKKIKNLSLHYLIKNDSIDPHGSECRNWNWNNIYNLLKNFGNVFISNNPEISNDSIYPHNFNVKDYKKLNKDLSHLPDHEALQHFKDFGLKEKRPYLIPLGFDYKIYIKFNSDLSNLNEEDALQHFIEHGLKEKRLYKLPDDFTVKNYKKFNSDLVTLSDEQATEHFITHGIKEKRRFNLPDDFDIESYKNLYQDLSKLSNSELLEHYINVGLKENRLYKFPIDFIPETYKILNKDLLSFTNEQAIEHFKKYGINEKRLYKLPDGFKIENYKKLNKDLSNLTDEQALDHFIKYGIKEKRKY